MNTPKPYNTKYQPENLIGNSTHRQFIKLQSIYGIAQRGGSRITHPSETLDQRLVSDINLLDSVELRKLIFSEVIISN